ncbi:hypothetical protein F4776DRAFT_657595 [Hypoxylon sp. NC0597]|nr:hypothetical protein F4776DRAFT_657595 [Hypoxylon sp. NC0597]
MSSPCCIHRLAGTPLELPNASLQVSPSTFWGSRGAKHRNPILPAFSSPSSSQPSCSLMAGFSCISSFSMSAELVVFNDILPVILILSSFLSFSLPQRRTRTRNGGGEDSVRLRAFAVCPSNPAPLVLPLLYILRYADVHLPPTYLRFPLAAPRYHIHGPNKTYTPPPLSKPDPSICFLASLQTCHPSLQLNQTAGSS